jgi:hypothetical protein
MAAESHGLRALPPALVLAFGLDVMQRGWSALAKLDNWGETDRAIPGARVVSR